METAPPQEPVPRWRGIVAIVAMAAACAGLPIGIVLVAVWWLPSSLQYEWTMATMLTVTHAVPVGAAVGLLAWLRREGEWRRAIRKWFSGGAIGGLAFGLSLSLPIPVVILIVGGTGSFSLPKGGGVAWQVSTVTLIPLAEEIVFRGFFFGVLWREVRLSPWTALVVSSLLFGAIHEPPFDGFFGLASSVILHGSAGALLCWAFWRRGEDLCFPIGFHAGVNLWCAVVNMPSRGDRMDIELAMGASKIGALALTYVVLRVMEERKKAVGTVESVARPIP